MFQRKALLAATVATAFAATPAAAFATPAHDLRGEAAATGGTTAGELAPRVWARYPTPLPRPVQSAPLTVDGGGDAGSLVLLAAAGTLALAGGIGMVTMRPHIRTAR